MVIEIGERLPPRHLPGHVEQKAPVGFAHAREQFSELVPKVDFLAGGAPRVLGRELVLACLRRAYEGRTTPAPVEPIARADEYRKRMRFRRGGT